MTALRLIVIGRMTFDAAVWSPSLSSGPDCAVGTEDIGADDNAITDERSVDVDKVDEADNERFVDVDNVDETAAVVRFVDVDKVDGAVVAVDEAVADGIIDDDNEVGMIERPLTSIKMPLPRPRR